MGKSVLVKLQRYLEVQYKMMNRSNCKERIDTRANEMKNSA